MGKIEMKVLVSSKFVNSNYNSYKISATI